MTDNSSDWTELPGCPQTNCPRVACSSKKRLHIQQLHPRTASACHAAKAAECAQGDNCAVTASTARQPKNREPLWDWFPGSPPWGGNQGTRRPGRQLTRP
jgi:hypothetical protein